MVEGVLGVFHLANYLLQHDAKLFARLQRRNHPFLGGCALLHSCILPVSAALARHLFQLHFHVLCRSSGLALFESDLQRSRFELLQRVRQIPACRWWENEQEQSCDSQKLDTLQFREFCLLESFACVSAVTAMIMKEQDVVLSLSLLLQQRERESSRPQEVIHVGPAFLV